MEIDRVREGWGGVALSLSYLLFVCLTLFFSYTLVADAGTWVRKDEEIPGVHDWIRVAMSDDGTTMLAVDEYLFNGDDSYLWTSTDSGVTWVRRDAAGLLDWRGVAVSSDGSTMYAEGGTSLWRSTDDGVTWTELTTAGSRNWVAIDCSSDGQKVVAAAYNGYIYTSSDSGSTWTEQTLSGSRPWTDQLGVSGDGMTIVAAAGTWVSKDYVYTSTDGGINWTQQVTAGQRDWEFVTASADGVHLAAATSSKGIIWGSDDSGATWTARSVPIANAFVGTDDLEYSSDGSLLFIVLTDNSIKYSSDNGASWSACGILPSTELNASRIGVSTDGSRIILPIADAGPIFLSSDSCATWTDKKVPKGTYNWTAAAASADGSVLLVSDYPSWSWVGALYRSTDSGATWESLDGAGYHKWMHVAVSGDGTRMYAADDLATFYFSADGGDTWATSTTPLDFGIRYEEMSNSMAVSDDGMTLAVLDGSDQIETSTDGGDTWVVRDLLSMFPSFFQLNGFWITMSNDGSRIAALMEEVDAFWNYNYRVYSSTDGGASWTPATNSAGVDVWWNMVAASNDTMTLYSATSTTGDDTYIMKSSDGGDSWSELTNSPYGWWCDITSSADGLELVAGAGDCWSGDPWAGYLYSSPDGGATWSQESDPGTRTWTAVASSDDGNVVLAVESGDSDDNGNNRYSGHLYIGTFAYPPDSNPPTVSTAAASSVTDTSATLNGSIDDVGSDAPTTRGFTYGLTTAYGATTTEVNGGGFSTGAFSASISSLTCGTTYHIRSYVTNTTETVYGSDQTLETTACAAGGGSGGGNGILISLKKLLGLDDTANDDTPSNSGSNQNDSVIDKVINIIGGIVTPTPAPPQNDDETEHAEGSQGAPASGVTKEVPATPQAPALLPSKIPSDAVRLLSALGAYGAIVLGFAREHDQALALTALSLGSLLWLLKYLLMATGIVVRARSLQDVRYILRGATNRFFTVLGLRERRREWGVVYDAESKQALDPCLVELCDASTQEVVEEAFTDIHGRYGFLDRVGAFVIRTKKTHYLFPSRIITGNNDAMFDNVYHGERFEITGVANAIVPNIPMDQLASDWNQDEKKRMGIGNALRVDAIIQDISSVLFWGGFAVSLVVVVASPSFINALFGGLYAIFAVLTTYLPTTRLWGVLKSSRHSVSGLSVALRHPQTQTVIARATTDTAGRFFLKATPGRYEFVVLARHDAVEMTLSRSDVEVGKHGTLNATIRM